MLSETIERRWGAVLAVIVLLSCARVAATHRVFSQTFDEGIHIAAGHEWLTEREYHVDAQHPPLAVVLFGLPFIHEKTDVTKWDPIRRGNDLLAKNGDYTRNLAHGRLGNLLFLALGIVVVGLWGRHVLSPMGGAIAAALFALQPVVLAHAGLATTDMAITAALPLALYALTLFLDTPSWRRTIFLGLAAGIAAVTKFSFLMFFPLGLAILVVVRRRFPIARLVAAGVIAFVVIWAAYKFDVDTIGRAHYRGNELATTVFGSDRLAQVRLPAPAFFGGALEVKEHDIRGHQAFLLGEMSRKGWWGYFPVAFGVKTPIPFLLLSLAGTGLAFARRRLIDLALIPLAILGASMTSHINLGVRHVLPMYPFLAIVAAYACLELRRARYAAGVLAAWLLLNSALAHPDYLPWMNAFAGRHPEHVLVDSNFDWGQDVGRLARLCRREGISEIHTAVFTSANLDDLRMPRHLDLPSDAPVSGWCAISESSLQPALAQNPVAWWWLTQGHEFRRVGKTIRLYRIP